MRTAVIPQVRVEPELCSALESVLREGETLSQFVESARRSAVEFRRVQASFLERAEHAWQRYQRTGESVAAEAVLAALQDKLGARRGQLRP